MCGCALKTHFRAGGDLDAAELAPKTSRAAQQRHYFRRITTFNLKQELTRKDEERELSECMDQAPSVSSIRTQGNECASGAA